MADPIELLRMLAGDANREALATYADSLAEDERIAAIRLLGEVGLATLYARAENLEVPADLGQLVPADQPKAAVTWEGQNSLPACSAFAKVFTRVGAPPDGLLGYNRNPEVVLAAVGPGYFTCLARRERASELVVDYTREPAQGVPGWPPMRKNSERLSRLVYYNAHDYLRPVGKNLFIGADYDAVTGKPRGHFFALARGATATLS